MREKKLFCVKVNWSGEIISRYRRAYTEAQALSYMAKFIAFEKGITRNSAYSKIMSSYYTVEEVKEEE